MKRFNDHYSLYIFALAAMFLTFNGCRENKGTASLVSEISSLSGNISVQLAQFDQSHLVASKEILLDQPEGGSMPIEFEGSGWTIEQHIEPVPGRDRTYIVRITARLEEGEANQVAVGLLLDFNNWSTENYVLLPAAAYQGNRFRAKLKMRGITICDQWPCSPDMPISMNTVPRLNIGEGFSKIDQLSGDMSTPSIGIRWPDHQSGFLLLSEQGTETHDYSYTIEESHDRSSSRIMLRMPAVREDSVVLGKMYYPSPDRAVNLKAGEEISLECKIYFFDAPEIQDMFDQFLAVRKDIGEQELRNEIPYSATWAIQEEKYNKQNWVEQHGYYSVGMRESQWQDWQTGWVGGMNAVFPLLVNGDETTQRRALRTFDFLFDTIPPSGIWLNASYNGEWFTQRNMAFLRRNSDALYFTMKSYNWILETGLLDEIPEKWNKAARDQADAYVRLYEKYGQFGQWVDFTTGDIVVGSTSSNGIAPAALALCAEYFDNQEYLEVALATAEDYYTKFVQKGITNGGPGDIYQAPDSESAFGLLESFVILYEHTGDKKWLDMAEDLAAQCATWVVSYNFRFPPQSTFGKMDMLTTGTVIANVQNKHSAPGICSLSGNSLFKLYRYTGNEAWIELISDISRAIPQYMSRADRPIPDVRPGVPWPVMDPGWINERINMSDWEERGNQGDIKRGEIFGGSTWAEVACMLSYAELPGVYVISDEEKIWVMDNVEAEITESSDRELTVKITNPTAFDAAVKIYTESSDQQSAMLEENTILACKEVMVVAGESKEFVISK